MCDHEMVKAVVAQMLPPPLPILFYKSASTLLIISLIFFFNRYSVLDTIHMVIYYVRIKMKGNICAIVEENNYLL